MSLHSYKLIWVISYQSLLLFVLLRGAERKYFVAVICLNPHSVLKDRYAAKDLSGFVHTLFNKILTKSKDNFIHFKCPEGLNGVHFQNKRALSLWLLLDTTFVKFSYTVHREDFFQLFIWFQLFFSENCFPKVVGHSQNR